MGHRDRRWARLDLYVEGLGGQTLVECTLIGLRRTPFGLRWSGERTEVMITDLTDRADGTGIRSGLIGGLGTGRLQGSTDAQTATSTTQNPARWLSGEAVA